VAAHDAAGAGGALPVFAMDPTLLDSAGSARLGALHEAPSGARESFDDALVVRHGRPEEVLPARAAGRAPALRGCARLSDRAGARDRPAARAVNRRERADGRGRLWP
jgi:deoxyribodipyrimidine photo-lyase